MPMAPLVLPEGVTRPSRPHTKSTQPRLGRPLSTDEVLEFSGMARRIAALVLLQPALDENYRACVSSCGR